MKLGNIKLMAAVSAVALGVAMYSTTSLAVDVESGDNIQVNITGTVLNTIDITYTPIDFGTIAAVARNGAPAYYTVAPNDAVTDDAGPLFTDARIIQNTTSTPAAADIDIVAFPNTPIFVDYDVTGTDLTFSGETLFIAHVTDNLTVPGNFQAAAPYNGVGAATSQGSATTDPVTGALSFNVGATIATDATQDLVYPSGAYTGSVEVTISY